MATTKTLLNFRESAVPVMTDTESLGLDVSYPKTWVREYRAVIQVLQDGPTPDVNDESEVLRAEIGVVESGAVLPGFFSTIRIDDSTFFNFNSLNPTVPGTVFTMLTEASGSYAREDYGKMQVVYTIEVMCPQEYWDAEAAIWKLVDSGEDE